MRIESGALINTNVVLRNQLELAVSALKFYASQSHFDVVKGKTRILDNGGVAEEAFRQIEGM